MQLARRGISATKARPDQVDIAARLHQAFSYYDLLYERCVTGL